MLHRVFFDMLSVVLPSCLNNLWSKGFLQNKFVPPCIYDIELQRLFLFNLRFAQASVIRSCTILLRDYKKNTTYTNHCLAKMLHRVGFDCDLVGMLYQVSLFRVFHNIMSDPACRTKHFQVRLCTHVSVPLYHSSDGRFAATDVCPQFLSTSIKFTSECEFPDRKNRSRKSAVRWRKSQPDACEHCYRN